ncbi:MAG: hypothetical protein HPM95_05970 [Alphaproteobacteria bacterium]|nr:hypothetical protein [Alphaproteobacteria bacterium]
MTTQERLEILETVARAIGDDWNDDATSFLDVTIAMGRLQCVMRQNLPIGSAGRPERQTADVYFWFQLRSITLLGCAFWKKYCGRSAGKPTSFRLNQLIFLKKVRQGTNRYRLFLLDKRCACLNCR